jgi:hypothetical protein
MSIVLSEIYVKCEGKVLHDKIQAWKHRLIVNFIIYREFKLQ